MVADTNLTEKWADNDSNKVKPGLNGLLFIIIVFGLLLLTSIITLAQSDDQIPIRTERLSENVMFFNTGESSALTNVVAVSTDDGVVVIDTSPTLGTARKIRSSIEKAFGQTAFPFVIYTHGAYDHTAGVEAFKDATVIGHERCLYEFEQLNQQLQDPDVVAQASGFIDQLTQQAEAAADNPRQQKAIYETTSFIRSLINDFGSGTLFTIPTITFTDTLTLRSGGTTFEMTHSVISYSESDVIIYIPEERVLVVGDVFNKGRLPMISERSDIPRWMELFQPYLQGGRNIDHYIGGHGDLLTLSEIKAQLDYIDALYRSIKSAREAGMSTEEIAAQHSFESFGHLSEYDTTFHGMPGNIHESNVQNILKMLDSEM